MKQWITAAVKTVAQTAIATIGTAAALGADGQETYLDKPLKERFKKPVTANEGVYYKNILQPNRIDSMRTHYPIFDEKKHQRLNGKKEEVIIHHYYTKSWEEWKEKMARGSCDPNYLKHLNEFFVYNPDMAYLKTDDVIQEYKA